MYACPIAERRARGSVVVDVRPLSAWQTTSVQGATVTATPAKHQVSEVTFVIEGDGHTVYFADDTLLIPEHRTIADRFPHIDLALVPTNGLRIRPLLNKKIVMDADDAAELVTLLHPSLAIPHHYAFTSGPLGDRVLTKHDRDRARFAAAVRRRNAAQQVRIADPGERGEVL